MSAPPPSPPATRRLFFLCFAVLAVLVFGPALLLAPRYKSWDFGPHHVLTRVLARGLSTGHVPRYLTSVSTGDSPYEMYPLPTYGLAAALTLLTGDEANAPAVLTSLAVSFHVLNSALIARLASHFAPLPLAFALGLAAFFDVGSFESGAAQTVLEVGLLHGALAQCLLLAATDAVLLALRFGTRRARAVAIWLLTGLAVAVHPSSLLYVAALLLALLVAAASSGTARPRNLLGVACHVTIGALLSAFAWLPFASRVMLYGLHFAYPAPPLFSALREFLALQQPPTSFPALLALGYLGALGGLLRRRGRCLVLAALTTALLLAFTELPHRLYFDWLPRTLARLQSFRFLTLARPLLFVSASLPLVCGWRWLRARPGVMGLALPWGSLALGALAFVSTAWRSDVFPTGIEELRSLVTAEVEDRPGFEELIAWARERQQYARPDRFARLMWAGPENASYHVAAETGMPTFFVGDGVAMLLRERIEDNSPESVLRFNVRWLVAHGQAPGRGDASSERRFGSYVVRELKEWDGHLARIEKGSGSVRVAALQDERIEVELTNTEAPALVALGLGYYPRWRAQRTDGTAVPVFAVPATPQASVRVLAAWLSPGRTIFSADAPLASDRLGLAPSVLGLGLAALTLASVRASRRARKRALRTFSARRLRLVAAGLLLGLVAATLILGALPRSVDRALRLVPGWRPEALVEARAPGSEWTRCRFDWLRRDFSCPDLGRIGDGVAYIVRDHPSSTPFLTPGIVAHPAQNRVEYRVRVRRRLEGRHWAATWGLGGATVRCGEQTLALDRRRRSVDLSSEPAATDCELELRTRGRAPQGATLVRADAVDVDRTRDVPWAPEQPPQAVARLTKDR